MESLHKNKHYFGYPKRTGSSVKKEIDAGLRLLNSIKNRIVTVFGSHIPGEKNKYCRDCYKTAYELGKEGFAVMTGGGPGIMKAANLGAFDAGAPSIGIKAKLLQKEQSVTDVHTHVLELEYLFVRKFLLAIKSEALIFYPGGFGTLDELFGFVVLIQTKMTDKVPIICVNKKYWKGLFEWSKRVPLKNSFISSKDFDLFFFAENSEDILRIIEGKNNRRIKK